MQLTFGCLILGSHRCEPSLLCRWFHNRVRTREQLQVGNHAVVPTHNCTWNQVQGNSCVLIARLLHCPREQLPGAGGTSGRQRRCRSRTWLPRPPSPTSPPASLTPPISICFFYSYSSYFSSTIFASHVTVQNWYRSILPSAGLSFKESQRHNEPPN